MKTKRDRIYTPGPVPMSDSVRAIAGNQLPYNRTEQFSQLTSEIIDGLKYIFGTNGDVVLFSASGTGAMEATVLNFLDGMLPVLIINGGVFGQRWVDLCAFHGIPFQQIELRAGALVSPERIDHELSAVNYSAVLLNAHETSTGVLYDTEAIGNVTYKHNVCFIVDAISTICCDQFLMDKWHVDIALLSSQKGLALPPGLSFLAFNERAQKMLNACHAKSFYFNIPDYLNNQERGQVPYTPCIGIFLMLHLRLQEIKSCGIDDVVCAHAELAQHFRTRVRELPFSFVPDNPSNCLTALSCDAGLNAPSIVDGLAQHYQCFVAPNGGALKEKVFRVSHMGAQNVDDVDFLVDALKNTIEI